MSIKIPGNDPCPCGSGLKYEKCCIDKDFDWVVDKDGQIKKRLELSQELLETVEELEALFKEKHGRDPGPNDLLVEMDPDGLIEDMVAMMRGIGADEAHIYALRKTERVVTEENIHLLSDMEIQEWEDAVNEYYELYGENLEEGERDEKR